MNYLILCQRSFYPYFIEVAVAESHSMLSLGKMRCQGLKSVCRLLVIIILVLLAQSALLDLF